MTARAEKRKKKKVKKVFFLMGKDEGGGGGREGETLHLGSTTPATSPPKVPSGSSPWGRTSLHGCQVGIFNAILGKTGIF